MAVPKYFEFYHPFLAVLEQGDALDLSTCKRIVKEKMNLSDEQLFERTKKGDALWMNRVEWCATYLKHAGLIESPKRAMYRITESGRALLSENVEITDDLLTERYPSFRDFKRKKAQSKTKKYTKIKKPDINVFEAENIADDGLITQLQESIIPSEDNARYNKNQPKARQAPVVINGRTTYPRDRKTAVNALSAAHFCCEINKEHPTFIRCNADLPYTEPHHLIPMAYQDQFDVSLDVEENIVSLCCTCHKEIHYGANAAVLADRLFNERKRALEQAGICISEDDFLSIYKYKE